MRMARGLAGRSRLRPSRGIVDFTGEVSDWAGAEFGCLRSETRRCFFADCSDVFGCFGHTSLVVVIDLQDGADRAEREKGEHEDGSGAGGGVDPEAEERNEHGGEDEVEATT